MMVDACVLVDVAEGDPVFSFGSAQVLDQKRSAGVEGQPKKASSAAASV
jgi:hypothetical protein